MKCGRLSQRQGIVAAIAIASVSLGAGGAAAQAVPMGTAAGFAILAGSTITNTGPSVITGNMGVSPGTAITGFSFSGPPGPGLLNGAFHLNDAVAIQAQIDLVNAFTNLEVRPATIDLTGQDLGGLVLTAGVYNYDSSAQLTGALTLDGEGNPNALFIINIGDTLTTASNSSVVLVNGAQGGNVFFVVGSSATLGTATAFAGDILALTSITLTTGANILCGAALARNGAVTLDTNTITVCQVAAATVADVLGPDVPDNLAAVADVIDFFADEGTLPPEFVALIGFLSPGELAAVIAMLSGEAATGVAAVGTQAMTSFLSLAMGTPGQERGVAFPPATDLRPLGGVTSPSNNTVSTMGYFETPAVPPAFADVDRGPVANPQGRRIWASAYGGRNLTVGDPAIGSHDRSAGIAGFAIGIDLSVTPNATLGFALGVGATNFALSDNLGGGRSLILQAAVNGRMELGPAYVAAAVAYARHSVTTERSVTTFGTTDQLVAAFAAHNVGARIEAGYRLGNAHGSVTPYGAVEVQAFFTPAYSETAAAGAPTFALSYDANTTITVRTELGARLERTIAMNDRMTLVLRGHVAWVHQNTDATMTATFQAMPGMSFDVAGAERAANSLLVSAGAELNFASGLSIAGLVEGEFARGSRTLGGSIRIAYSW